MTFANSLLVAVVGMLVVFFGLVVLIMLIKLMGVLTGNMGKKEAPKAEAPKAEPVKPEKKVEAPKPPKAKPEKKAEAEE